VSISPGPDADLARGATVQISVIGLLGTVCTRTVTIKISYHRGSVGGFPAYTQVGTATIQEPAGTRAPASPARQWAQESLPLQARRPPKELPTTHTMNAPQHRRKCKAGARLAKLETPPPS
jgi:hypothetical protein